jgi:prophage DNA circulation protein
VGEAAYTSPGGTRMRFAYEDVSYELEKRTAAFSFPGVNGTYVQDNGHSERRFPLRCIFSGAECDREALAFESLLLERGAGRLDHPLYGRVDVVPFGTITRRDDLLTAANQTILEVVFWSTVGAVYPSSRLSPKHEVTQSLGRSSAALSGQFSRAMNLQTEARRANAKLTVAQALRNVQAALGQVAAVTESVNREFRDLQQQINFGIDVLIGTPLLLARSILNLITAPGRALAGILSRLQGYADLLDRMVASSKSTPGDLSVLPALRLRLSNDFHTSSLFAAGAVMGSVTSVVNNTFTAKPQAIEAAERIIVQSEVLTAWNDGRFGDLEQIDTGEGYQSLQETVALAVGFLVEISFSLVPERAVVLDRPRSLIDLSAELYGSVDDRLDFLISTNRLTGSEILELPRGRRVVYYA